MATFKKFFKGNKQQPTSTRRSSTPKIKDDYINILLLGETGVGKSTFINSFVNYYQFQDFNNAVQREPICVVPAKFSFYDENMKQKIISVGEDKNEFTDSGVSATQGTKSYVFPMPGLKLRIIDTPGMGDTRGIEQDKKNVENILDFLSQFEKLHAICILLKPNQSRLTVWFEFCIKQILSKLDKSAANNLIFVFTNSRSTFYRPGDTKTLMDSLLQKIKNSPPHVAIPFCKDNIFCMDNEAYRFLIAVRNSITFKEEEKKDFSSSWRKSVEETIRLVKYVIGDNNKPPLEPHIIQNTLSINESRRVIYILSKPLADITQLIDDNKRVLTAHQNKLQKCREQNQQLSGKLYIPCVKLKVKEKNKPTTVCSADKCSTVKKIEGCSMKEYNQKCHDPCYLTQVPKEIIGTRELIYCAAMDPTGNCRVCGCNFTVHMHIYYTTERYNSTSEDQFVKSQLDNLTTEEEKYKKMMELLEKQIREHNEEHNTILKNLAKFAHFLQENSIVPFNDSYKAYIEYLIDREENLGENADKMLINSFKEMLRKYNEEKKLLDRGTRTRLANGEEINSISPQDIKNCVANLFRLKHMGQKLKDLYNIQEQSMKTEHHHNQEYFHSTVQKKSFLDFQPNNDNFEGDIKLVPHLIELVMTEARKLKIVQVQQQGLNLKVKATNQKDLDQAMEILNIRENIFNVTQNCAQKFLDNRGEVTDEIIRQSGLLQIQIIGTDDKNFKGVRRPDSVPFVLLGNNTAITKAKTLFHTKINTWKNLNLRKVNMRKTFRYNGRIKVEMQTKNSNTKDIDSGAYDQFKFSSKLEGYIYGENGGNIYEAYKIDGIRKVWIENLTMKILGDTREAVKKARTFLEYSEATIDGIPNHSDFVAIFNEVKRSCCLPVLTLTPNENRSSTIYCIGTKPNILKAQRKLRTFFEEFDKKINLKLSFINNSENIKDTVVEKPVGTEPMSYVRTTKDDNTDDIKETISLPRQFVTKLLEENAQIIRGILKRNKGCKIKIIGDEETNIQDSIDILLIGPKNRLNVVKTQLSTFEQVFCDYSKKQAFIKTMTFEENEMCEKNVPASIHFYREEIEIPPHLMFYACGSIEQNLDKARNIRGVKSVERTSSSIIVESENKDSFEKAKEIIDIRETEISIPEELFKRYKLDESKFEEIKSRTGVLSVKFPKFTMNQPEIFDFLSNKARNVIIKQSDTPTTTIVLALPYRLTVKLIENDGGLLKTIIKILNLEQIKVIEEEDVNSNVNFLIMGTLRNVSVAMEIFENSEFRNLLKADEHSFDLPPKITNCTFKRVDEPSQTKVQVIGTLKAIEHFKLYLQEMLLFCEFVAVENADLPLVLGSDGSNFKVAGALPNVKVILRNENVFKIVAFTKQAIDEAKKYFIIKEKDFEMSPNLSMHYLNNKSTINKDIEQLNCKLINTSTNQSLNGVMLNFKIKGSAINFPDAERYITNYIQKYGVDKVEATTNIASSTTSTYSADLESLFSNNDKLEPNENKTDLIDMSNVENACTSENSTDDLLLL